MKVRVIWNANAGSKAGLPTNRTSEEQLRDVMARYGLGDELVATTSEEEAVASTREAMAAGYDAVIAAGGDGTVGTVGFTLMGSSTALGVFPLGSIMNVARSLEIPRDLESAAAIVAAGNVRTIDVGEANGVPFLEIGSVGLNAAIFGEAQRFDRGDFGGALGLIQAIVRYRPARMRIHLDNRLIRSRALMVAVSNAPYGGLGMTFAPRARMDDGLFDVRLYAGFSKLELLRHLWGILLGRRAFSPRIRTYRSRRVLIETTRPRPVRVDAHDLGTTPVRFRIRTRALRVLAPEPANRAETAGAETAGPAQQPDEAGAAA